MVRRFLLATLLAAPALFAMPVLSPGDPAVLSRSTFLKCPWKDVGVKFGYRGDFVTNRKLRNDEGTQSRKIGLVFNEGVLTFNFFRRVDLYGFFGAGHYSIHTLKHRDSGEGDHMVTQAVSETGFIGGVGIKGILWEGNIADCGRSFVALDFQYERLARTPLERLYLNGAFAATNGVAYDFHENQTSLSLGHRIYDCLLYVAIKWSGARFQPGHQRVGGSGIEAVRFRSYESYRNVGWAFGISVIDSSRMDVTAEARYDDEYAFTINANVRL